MTQFVVLILECSRAGSTSHSNDPSQVLLAYSLCSGSLQPPAPSTCLSVSLGKSYYYINGQHRSYITGTSRLSQKILLQVLPAYLPLAQSCQHETAQCLPCLETYLPSPFPCKTKYICQKQLRICHSTEATCCWNQFLYAIKYSYPTDSITTSDQDPSGLFVNNRMALTSIFCGLPYSVKCIALCDLSFIPVLGRYLNCSHFADEENEAGQS